MKKIFKKPDLNIRDEWKNKIISLFSFALLFIYCELVLHIAVYSSIDTNIIYPVLFALVSGSVLWLISSLCPEKANRFIALGFMGIVVIYYEVQLVYHCIFKGFMPFSQIFMGADAVTNFFSQMMYAIGQNIIPILILFIPLPLAIVLVCKKKINFKRIKLLQIPIGALICCIFAAATLITLHATNTSPTSAYAALVDPYSSTELCVKTNGLAVTTLQEIRSMISPVEIETDFLETSLDDIDNYGKELNDDGVNFTADPISKHLSSISATEKNEYTGIAKDYNLITICAEAFSPHLISKELTPTLYKLSNSGLIFNNFYNSFPNTTTNGEYALCTGLFPDMSRNKIDNSFNKASNNYLPYCLGNIYSSMGLEAYAYHNFYGTFYDRHISHENMGYDFRAVLHGLDMPAGSPSSDLDMMIKSIPDYINSSSTFHAYYMTYSGHYQYNWKNEMSAKNRDKVEDMPYSDEVKAYIACQLELEYALEHLMDELEKAGKADNTVIILTTDHYPYGLSDESFNELAGEEVDTAFDKFRNSFICYIPGIKATEIDAPCSTQDILPTVLNLMGIEFDSRLLPGRDVLSSATHVAVLSDRSFIAEDFKYNAATGEVITTSNITVTPEMLTDYQNYVSNMFTLSTAVLNDNYYAKVIEHKDSDDKKTALNFTDFNENSVYIESTVNFMVENGYMEPKSETVFGVYDPGTVKEFIEILYKMSDEAKKYKNAEEWATAEELATKEQMTSQESSTYVEIALIMYNYAEPTVSYTEEELNAIATEYPDLSAEAVIAMKWCNEKGIMQGTPNTSIFELRADSLDRYHVGAYAQRMYMYDLIK